MVGGSQYRAGMHENEVKVALIGFLLRRGFVLHDSAAHLEHGIDIVAKHAGYGRFLCIEAKGDGSGSARAPASGRETRFLISIGQVLTRMRPRTGYSYGLAYPHTYRALVLRRLDYEVLRVLRLRLYFVDQAGTVEALAWRDVAELQHTQRKRCQPHRRRAPAMSSLAAALLVLRTAGQPLSSNAIAHEALAMGWWRSRGRTPGATLSAAIQRDLRKKGTSSLFRRAERGRYTCAQ